MKRLAETEGWAVVWIAPLNVPYSHDVVPFTPCSGACHVFESEMLAKAAHAALEYSLQRQCRVARVRVLVEEGSR